MVLTFAALVVYANSLTAPFVFDDVPAITQNPGIRDFAPGALLAPPTLRGTGVVGRPVVSLTLAINHAIGGDDVRGYHAANVMFHLGAGLLLYGVVRRTLIRLMRARAAGAMALVVALLWIVHPLQTESVTCVIQRTESLAGLLYLLTFYCFIRAAETPQSRHWSIGCWLASAVGCGTKELLATAPVLLLLYDRAFLAGSFRAAWRRRGRLHVALAGTWILVGVSIWMSDTRGGTVGFGRGVAWWEYALTQCRAIILYLELALWPYPLVMDYGTEVVREIEAVWPQALALIGLVGTGIWLQVRRPRVGFLFAWFFVILAPSSSVVPLVTQTMAEHRMYLPLAALITGLVVAAWRLWPPRARWVAGAIAATALGIITVQRNADYASVEGIWRDTVEKWPNNARAHYTLAQLAEDAGRLDDAIQHGEAAVRLLPEDATAHFNLAFTFNKAGRLEDAIRHYERAIALKPTGLEARINLGAALVRSGRASEAIPHYEAVVKAMPESPKDQFNLGQAYYQAGRWAEAASAYAAATRLMPDSAEPHFRLGHALVKLNRVEQAAAAFREASRLQPEFFEAHVNAGGALLMLGRAAEAVEAYERALALQPDRPEVRANLATARTFAR